MAEKSPTNMLELDIPDSIGKYRLLEPLGKGTCGVVYKGFDPSLGRHVAVKISPNAEREAGGGKKSKFPASHRAFLTEAAAAGRLRHPNIITLFDAGMEGDLNYLVMEYIPGATLKQYGKGQRLLPPRQVLRIMLDCLKALEYSHRNGVVHRDIKPSNIMLSEEDGHPKLLDFGIAVSIRRIRSSNDRPSLGTPNYMSPEQIRGKPLGPESDLYSLATVMFEMLSGERLFRANKVKALFKAVLHEEAPRLDERCPNLPSELADVLARALAKRPEERFGSATEFSTALTQVLEVMDPVVDKSVQKPTVSELKELPFFCELSEFDIAELLKSATYKDCAYGDVMVREGELAKALYLVVDGAFCVTHNDQFVETISAGECFGEAWFAHSERAKTSVKALTQGRVFEIDRHFFDAISPRTQVQYYKAFSSMLANRLAYSLQPKIDVLL